MKGRLIIFCGLPGSGKTTIARLVASTLGQTVHVQTDSFRFMFPRPSFTREESSFVYNAMFQVGKEALRHGYDAILDATFLKEDYRQEAARKLARHYSSLFYVVVTCNLKTVLRRNELREGPSIVPRETLLRFHSMFERPKEGIFIDSSKRSPKSCAAMIVKRLGTKKK